MCCASTARVNEIGEKVICKYGNTEIGMPVFMDGISAIGDADTNKTRTKTLQKNGIKEKNNLWTEKDKLYDNDNWKRETRTNRRRGKGRKD